LEHLAFAIDRNTLLHAAGDGIGAAQGLRRVTVEVCPGGRVHPSLPGLKVACAVNGVSLTRAGSPRAFRALIRGDPLPNASFPRTKKVMNLKTMLAISRSKGRAVAVPRCVLASGNTEGLAACGTPMFGADQVEDKQLSKPDPASVAI